SGEGRWTVQAAVDHQVPLPVITAALFARFSSRQDDSPAMKVVAALRNQFGGHAITSTEGSTAKGVDSPGADVLPPPRDGELSVVFHRLCAGDRSGRRGGLTFVTCMSPTFR